MKLSHLFTSIALVLAVSTAAHPEDNPHGIYTMTSTGDSSILAVQVHLRAAISKPASGHEYMLRYQLRLHTKVGEAGPLLGSADRPDGVAFDLGKMVKPKGAGWRFHTVSAPATTQRDLDAAAKTLEFDGSVDITRKELSTMTKLPKNSKVIVRVEPQISDLTEDKFITSAKSNAVVLFLETGPAGQVWSVRTFEKWFPNEFGGVESAKAAIGIMQELDMWDSHSSLVNSFEQVLGDKNTKPEIMTLAVRAIPAKLIHSKNSLSHLLSTLANSEDSQLKAAAANKLAEVK